jgi:hypothetical protein
VWLYNEHQFVAEQRSDKQLNHSKWLIDQDKFFKNQNKRNDLQSQTTYVYPPGRENPVENAVAVRNPVGCVVIIVGRCRVFIGKSK